MILEQFAPPQKDAEICPSKIVLETMKDYDQVILKMLQRPHYPKSIDNAQSKRTSHAVS